MFLDVSLTQAMVAFQGYMLIQAVIEGDRPEVLAVPSGVYPTADGWVSLAVINEPQWPRLAAAIGRPDLVRDERFSTRERRGANHVLLNGIVGEAIKNQGTASLLARLQQSDVPHSRLNGYRELLNDEHIRHTGAVEWLDQPGIGCIPLAMIPGHDRGARASVKAPAVGEHSFEILRELGLTSSEIDTLASTKAVVRPATAILEG
jgi:crotonobetainyl-CoA:carnitine CoA-transferase CaiB-like acyl-CoA transferase